MTAMGAVMTEARPKYIPTREDETAIEFYLFTFFIALRPSSRTVQRAWDDIRKVCEELPSPYDERFPLDQEDAPIKLKRLARRNKWRARAKTHDIHTHEGIARKTVEAITLSRTKQTNLLDKQLNAVDRLTDKLVEHIAKELPNMKAGVLVNLFRTLLGQTGQLLRTRALVSGDPTSRVEFTGQLELAHALLGTTTVDDIIDRVPGVAGIIASTGDDESGDSGEADN